MSDDIDMIADCEICGADIEHYAGITGSEFMTPFWRHPDGTIQQPPHPAVPDPDTIQEVAQ